MPSKRTIILIVVLILFALGSIFLFVKQDTPSTGIGMSNEQGSERERPAPQGENVYENTDYGFSFFYPENYNVGVFSDEENTKTILVQNTEKNVGVQIYISAFDENIVLTAERIKKEIPELVMKDVKKVFVGNTQGVSFKSVNESLGESREVWFIHKMNLYQLSASIPASDLLDDMVKSWKWD